MAITNRKQISILLTIIAILLWAHSILFVQFQIGYFGLIHSLPITFFVALAFLTAASAILWVSKEKHEGLLCLQLLIFVSALWLIPPLTGGSYPNVSEELWVLRQGNYIAEESRILASQVAYLSWPGVQILSAILARLLAINLEPISDISPFFMQLLYLVPVYFFLRNMGGNERANYCWAGLWIFSLASWTAQTHFCPQGVAYFLFLVLLALITTPSLWEKSSKSVVLLSLTAVTFAALVVTHLLTSIAALCILVVLCAVKRGKRVAPVVAVCLLLLVCWDFTGGGSYIKYATCQPIVTTVTAPPPSETAPPPSETAPPPSETAPPPQKFEPGIRWGLLTFEPSVIAETEVMGHLSGSASHIAVCRLRILFSGILAALALASAILLLVRRKFSVVIPLIVIALTPLLLLLLSSHYAGGLIGRLYLFALPCVAYLVGNLLDVKRRERVVVALCLILIAVAPLHVISHYGNQALDYFPPREHAELYFFDNKTTHGYIAGMPFLVRVKSVPPYPYQAISFSQLDHQGDMLTIKTPLSRTMPFYIGTSCRDKERYNFFGGDAQSTEQLEQLANSAVNCNLVYDNQDFKIYILRLTTDE